MSSEMMDKLNALARQNHVKREPDIVLDAIRLSGTAAE